MGRDIDAVMDIDSPTAVSNPVLRILWFRIPFES